ncbi:MAG: hypothetical protein AABX82_07065 [Nanoarchaeota archaeon]
MKRFSRFSIISLSLLLLLTLFAVTVYAQNYDISNAFGEVAKVINSIAKAFRSTVVIEGFVRFAFWVFIFAGISAANSKIENKMMKRAVHVLAAILATYGAFRVTSKLIIGLFNFPYAVIVILWGLVVPIAGFLLTKKIFPDEEKRSHRFGRAVLFLLLVLLMFNIMDVIQKSAGPDTAVFMRMLWPVRIGAAIALLFGLVNLAMALGGDKAVDAVRERLGLGTGAGTTGTPAAPGAAAPPAPRDEAVIGDLQRQMAQFHNAVVLVPNNIEHTTTYIQTQLMTDIAGLLHPPLIPAPLPVGTNLGDIRTYRALPPAALAAVRTRAVLTVTEVGAFQTSAITPARTLMETIFTRGHSTHQYGNCTEALVRQFEHAVAQFLTSEALLAHTGAFAASI